MFVAALSVYFIVIQHFVVALLSWSGLRCFRFVVVALDTFVRVWLHSWIKALVLRPLFAAFGTFRLKVTSVQSSLVWGAVPVLTGSLLDPSHAPS